MRDLLVWGTATLFLLAALYTVAVRREIYDLGRRIGQLEAQVLEQRRQNDNLRVLRERLRSPADLRARAQRTGLLPESGEER